MHVLNVSLLTENDLPVREKNRARLRVEMPNEFENYELMMNTGNDCSITGLKENWIIHLNLKCTELRSNDTGHSSRVDTRVDISKIFRFHKQQAKITRDGSSCFALFWVTMDANARYNSFIHVITIEPIYSLECLWKPCEVLFYNGKKPRLDGKSDDYSRSTLQLIRTKSADEIHIKRPRSPKAEFSKKKSRNSWHGHISCRNDLGLTTSSEVPIMSSYSGFPVPLGSDSLSQACSDVLQSTRSGRIQFEADVDEPPQDGAVLTMPADLKRCSKHIPIVHFGESPTTMLDNDDMLPSFPISSCPASTTLFQLFDLEKNSCPQETITDLDDSNDCIPPRSEQRIGTQRVSEQNLSKLLQLDATNTTEFHSALIEILSLTTSPVNAMNVHHHLDKVASIQELKRNFHCHMAFGGHYLDTGNVASAITAFESAVCLVQEELNTTAGCDDFARRLYLLMQDANVHLLLAICHVKLKQQVAVVSGDTRERNKFDLAVNKYEITKDCKDITKLVDVNGGISVYHLCVLNAKASFLFNKSVYYILHDDLRRAKKAAEQAQKTVDVFIQFWNSSVVANVEPGLLPILQKLQELPNMGGSIRVLALNLFTSLDWMRLSVQLFSIHFANWNAVDMRKCLERMQVYAKMYTQSCKNRAMMSMCSVMMHIVEKDGGISGEEWNDMNRAAGLIGMCKNDKDEAALKEFYHQLESVISRGGDSRTELLKHKNLVFCAMPKRARYTNWFDSLYSFAGG